MYNYLFDYFKVEYHLLTHVRIYIYINREIGHQGVQVEETNSSVSSPVSLDTQSIHLFNQSHRSICLCILIRCFQLKESTAICRQLMSELLLNNDAWTLSPNLDERYYLQYVLVNTGFTQCSIAPILLENHSANCANHVQDTVLIACIFIYIIHHVNSSHPNIGTHEVLR